MIGDPKTSTKKQQKNETNPGEIKNKKGCYALTFSLQALAYTDVEVSTSHIFSSKRNWRPCSEELRLVFPGVYEKKNYSKGIS